MLLDLSVYLLTIVNFDFKFYQTKKKTSFEIKIFPIKLQWIIFMVNVNKLHEIEVLWI